MPTDKLKPQLGLSLSLTSKRHLKKARAILKLGLRLIHQQIFQFEIVTKYNARYWMNLPWLRCSFTTVNIRPCWAPIFRACSSWDLGTVRHLLETGQASIYDVDEENRDGLLEVRRPQT
jgi:hypothetical protein